jgi:hypothetical protein
MNKRSKAASKETCAQESDDLNVIALSEFRSLVCADTFLGEEWKATTITLTDSGIPEGLSPFEELINGVDNVKAKDSQS